MLTDLNDNLLWNIIISCLILGKCFSSLYQMTPLHWTAEKGCVGIVKYLVEQGANISIQDVERVSVTITADLSLSYSTK